MPRPDAVTVIPPTAAWSDPWGHPQFYQGVTGKRILAYLVDLLVVAVLTALVWFATGFLAVLTLSLLMPLHIMLVPLVPFLYHTLTIAGDRSATWGMRLMGLKVMSLVPGGEGEYGRPTLFQAMILTVTFYASVALTAWFILLVALFNPRRRTLHDFVAGTVVVNDPRH